MANQNYCSLTYLEENKLHPTRTARFAAAKRFRLKNQYNIIGQVIASAAMIIWSVVPLALKIEPPQGFELFNIAASVTLLALSLYQQSGGYVDVARSLEASARAIDRLRGKVTADIGRGRDLDPNAYQLHSVSYAAILDEHPVNHAWTDLEEKKDQTICSKLYRWFSLHLRAGAGCWLSICAVIAPPVFIF